MVRDSELPLQVFQLSDDTTWVVAHSKADAWEVMAELIGDSPEDLQGSDGCDAHPLPLDRLLAITYEDEPSADRQEFVREHGELIEPAEPGYGRWELKLPAARWIELEGRSHLACTEW